MAAERGGAGERLRVCVVGLGYIGLPTALFLAAAGHRVRGVDIAPERVAAVNGGVLPLEEPGLEGMLRAAVAGGALRASREMAEADAFFICVPTPSRAAAGYPGEEADLGAVQAAARAVAGVLRPGNLVVLESTVPPGTTEGPVRAILEESGLRVHRDGREEGGCFYLAYCPERVIPGRIAHEMVHNDRVIGGCSREAARRAAALYGGFVRGELSLTDAPVAEMVKLMENTFRDVNIALANEFALLGERLGVDIWEAIALANRHPRVHIHRPGPGVGGHCIPVVPWFIVQRAPDAAPLIRLARAINAGMPALVAARARALVADVPPPARVAVLGLAYKADVDDVRQSPALPVVAGLRAAGVDVVACDPHVPRPRWEGLAGALGAGPGALAYAATVEEAVAGAHLLLLLVSHREFLALDPAALRGRMARAAAFDTCGALDAPRWRAAGFALARLGDGRTGAAPAPAAPALPGPGRERA